MREIKLNHGFIALVDDDDFERLSIHSWHCHRDSRHLVYAKRNKTSADGGKRGSITMHREIMGEPPRGLEIDHREHFVERRIIDNRRHNLRFVTRAQNNANQRKSKGRSIYKGASLHAASGLWRATLRHNGKHINVGYFKIEVHAAYAYDLAAVRLRGEFARTNFPVPGSHAWIFGEAL